MHSQMKDFTVYTLYYGIAYNMQYETSFEWWTAKRNLLQTQPNQYQHILILMTYIYVFLNYWFIFTSLLTFFIFIISFYTSNVALQSSYFISPMTSTWLTETCRNSLYVKSNFNILEYMDHIMPQLLIHQIMFFLPKGFHIKSTRFVKLEVKFLSSSQKQIVECS